MRPMPGEALLLGISCALALCVQLPVAVVSFSPLVAAARGRWPHGHPTQRIRDVEDGR